MNAMQRNLVGLGVVAAAAAGLGLYALYGVQRVDEKEARHKAHAEKLFALNEEEDRGPDGGAPAPDFLRIVVQAKGEQTTLSRSADGGWQLDEPAGAPADRWAVETLLSQLTSAKTKLKVEESPDDAALVRYGLKTPQWSVAATARSGSAERTVEVQGGIENSFDGSVYLRKGGDPAVYSAEGGVRWSLEKSRFELRAKQFIALDEARVLGIKVTAVRRPYELSHDLAKKSWQLLAPQAMPVDAPTVQAMLSTLSSEHAQAFPVDTPERRKACGLDAPAADATFTTQDGTVRVRLGRSAPDAGTTLCALREDSTGAVLAEISSGPLGQLDRDPLDLRDRAVLTFPKEQVARLAFRLADGSDLIAERSVRDDGGSGESWELTAPTRARAQTFKLSSLLWVFGSLKAVQFGEQQPKDWARYGLDERARAVTLFDRAGKSLGRLSLGKNAPEPGQLYARGTRDQVLVVDSSRLKDWPASPDDLTEGAPARDAGPPAP